MQEWRARYFSENHPFLFYAKALSYVTVYDGRTHQPTSERFDWPFSLIIEGCNETPKTLDQIRRAATTSPSHQDSAPSIDTAVSTLVTKRLLVEDKGRYFTLALPANPKPLTEFA